MFNAANTRSTRSRIEDAERNENWSSCRCNFLAAAFVRGFEMLVHLREFFRPGSLKAENGLLFVADSEYRSLQRPASSGTHCEFLGQSSNDIPLSGINVLGFVDQNMVDLPVKACT